MKRLRSQDPVRDGLLVATVLAVLAAGWFGFSWASAAADSDLSYGRDRDAVLAAAGDALVTLHTVDYRTVERDLDAWHAAATGALLRDLADERQDQLQRTKQREVVSTARLARAAVVELDAFAGTARVIAVLDVSVATRDGKPSAGHRRMNADLTRTDSGWKVSAVEAAS
ncbi:MAG: hypothetical protein ACRDQW_13680 [Haloechinothrix sp.]